LLSRDAYQALWDNWRREDGFEVLSCTSSNAFVSLQGDVAVFIHDVATELRMQGEQLFSQERETIVFKKQGFRKQEEGRWLACHEHLSAMPEGLPSP
jgi:ketosteroid isomerase-like protein